MNNFSNPSRPRTPSHSRSPAPPSTVVSHPPVPPDEPENESRPPQRKSSFSFLRRGKSVERMEGIKRTVSNGKLQKKPKHGGTVHPEPVPIPVQPPKIPDLVTQPKIQEFGGEGVPDKRLPYNVPIPRVPAGLEDAYGRSESMTNRGRYSYASSAVSTLNSPRRVRRRKDPTPFNILIVGARNSGKSSFGEFLRASLALPPRKQRPSYYHNESDVTAPTKSSPNFESEFLETEIGGERIGLTIWDSEGLEKNIVDLQLREIVAFIESKFDETLTEESKVIRSPGVKDPHIHCVVLLLDPVNLNKTITDAKKKQEAKINGSFTNEKSFLAELSPETPSALDENMDLQVLRALQGKTTVIPIISKADTVTSHQMNILKRSVYKELKAAKLDPFEVLGVENDEDDGENSDSDSDSAVLPAHNHKRLAEADEDLYRARREATVENFDLSDSSSSGSVIRKNNGASPAKPSDEPLPPLPLSVLTPEPITAHQAVLGAVRREFAWGYADPYDQRHCDFVRFKEAIFQEWFAELREASRELWYEGWRTSRLDASRARSTTFSKNPVPDREPTIPLIAVAPKSQYAVATAPVAPSSVAPIPAASKQSSRNTSGIYAASPAVQQAQYQQHTPTQQRFSPALQQQQRSHPNSPGLYPPQELSASPVPSYRGSPRLNQRVSPQPSQTMLHNKQSQQQAQQLLQQQQQQSQQRGYSPFQNPHSPQVGQNQFAPPVGDEVGVAR